jgi:hypothetical protein
MPDDAQNRKLSASEAEQVLARAASLDAEGVTAGELSADEIRQSALAAGIAPHAVERALREARSPAAKMPLVAETFMSLPAVTRAATSVAGESKLGGKELAMRLRAALGPDAVISEELGTMRARMGKTTLTVVPGKQTTVAGSSDYSGDVAITAIGFGVGGVFAGLISLLPTGAAVSGTSAPVAIGAMLAGGAVGLALWRIFWKRKLAQKAREVESMVSAVAASLSE